MVIDRDTPNARDGDRWAIGRCIAGVIRAKDGRGHYANTSALMVRLIESGTSPLIAQMTAEAAMNVGKTIADAARRWKA